MLASQLVSCTLGAFVTATNVDVLKSYSSTTSILAIDRPQSSFFQYVFMDAAANCYSLVADRSAAHEAKKRPPEQAAIFF